MGFEWLCFKSSVLKLISYANIDVSCLNVFSKFRLKTTRIVNILNIETYYKF